MNGPFYDFGLIGEEASLFFALFIGIGFGFFLERAGLGSANKLSAQFYLRDMTVFKMMFTAIITAMLGVFWLDWFGILHADLIYLTPTHIWPQLIGGLVFGVGFIVGGYCPGTSCVASATGSLDGAMNILGLFAGILLFGEVYPFLESFYTSGDLGQVTFSMVWGISEGVLEGCIVIMALIGFYVSEKLEEKYQHVSR